MLISEPMLLFTLVFAVVMFTTLGWSMFSVIDKLAPNPKPKQAPTPEKAKLRKYDWKKK